MTTLLKIAATIFLLAATFSLLKFTFSDKPLQIHLLGDFYDIYK